MLDLKEMKSALEDNILKTAVFEGTTTNIAINWKKQEKFGTSSITIFTTVVEDKDGNEINATTSSSLYMIERETGANLIIINNDKNDIVYNKYAKMEYIEEVVTNTMGAMVRSVEANVKRLKGIQPERKPQHKGNGNNRGGNRGNNNRGRNQR